MSRFHWSALLVLTILLTGCTRSLSQAPDWNPAGSGNQQSVALPSATPDYFYIPTQRPADAAQVTPTPDQPHYQAVQRQGPEQYVVQAGDTLGLIAQRYGIDIPALMEANNIANANLLEIGQTLTIPVPPPGATGPDFKIIPDSEIIYGPVSTTFDIAGFVRQQGGYLYHYTQEVEGEFLNGAQIVERVAQNYSVNPRLLLALLEFRSGWVSNRNPNEATLEFPLGYYSRWHDGLYRQLTWSANAINQGYYGWLARKYSTLILSDGSAVPVAPTVNAGTAAMQHYFGLLENKPSWEAIVTEQGFVRTYTALFGYPFDLSMEPIIPPGLTQPEMQLPFPAGEAWSFTGGPHGGWDSGSPWAALDFAPPGEPQGCVVSNAWVTAVTDGLIVRAANGAVVQDLDGDGFEQTGWTILYMHIDTFERVHPGTSVKAGERIGHPSCEGGVSNGTHVHIARRFNGFWIPANGGLPFVMDGWVSSGTDKEYDGFLKKGDRWVEAWDGRRDINQIQR